MACRSSLSSWHHEPARHHLDAELILCWLPCSDAERRTVTLETAKSHTLRMVPREVLLPVPNHVLVSRQRGANQLSCAAENHGLFDSLPCLPASCSHLRADGKPASHGETLLAASAPACGAAKTATPPVCSPWLAQHCYETSPAPAVRDTCKARHGPCHCTACLQWHVRASCRSPAGPRTSQQPLLAPCRNPAWPCASASAPWSFWAT